MLNSVMHLFVMYRVINLKSFKNIVKETFFYSCSLDKEIIILLFFKFSVHFLFFVKGKYDMKNYNLSYSAFQIF